MFGFSRRKKTRPRVFLGSITVIAPREGIRRSLEHAIGTSDNVRDTELDQQLRTIFCLPSADRVTDPVDTDLVLDVVVPSYQSGMLDITIVSHAWVIPVLWRPQITVSSRLSSLKNKRVRAVFTVTEKMPWREFLQRAFSLSVLARLNPVAGKQEFEILLCRACASLLEKMQKTL